MEKGKTRGERGRRGEWGGKGEGASKEMAMVRKEIMDC